MSEGAIDFDHVHPDYSRLYSRWVMSDDFRRGGLAVIAPNRYETRIRINKTPLDQIQNDAPVTGSSAESPPSRLSLQPSVGWSSSKTYLFKAIREPTDAFEDRKQRQVHFPLFKPIVNIFGAGVLRVEPSRTGVTGAWREWMTDVDLAGTDYDAFIRNSMDLGLSFGRYHAIPDRPRFDERAPSRLHQLARGERTYLTGLSPLDIVDWEMDAHGELIWARIIEPDIRPRSPLEKFSGTSMQYRVWYRDGWELYQFGYIDGKKDNGAWAMVDGGEHGFGRVPIATLWTSGERTFACESPLADVLDIDREVLNLYSQLGILEEIQSFALLYLPVEDGGSMGPIDVSPYSAWTGPPGGAPQYVSPGSELVNSKWQRIENRVYMIRQLTGVGRGRAEYSKEERSAESIMRESEDKMTLLAVLAKSAEEYDNKIMQLVASFEGDAMGDPPRANYPRTFDLKGISVQINELLQLASTRTVPMAAMVTLAKPIVATMLSEKGIDEKIITATLAGMDAEIQKAIAASRAGAPMGKAVLPSPSVASIEVEDVEEDS